MTAGDSRWQWVTVGSSPYQSVAVGDHWSQSLTISDWRHQSTPVGTSRYLSVTVNTSRWQSAPVGTSRYQSVTVGNSRYQSAPVGTSRHQSAPVGTSRHQSASLGTSRWQSVPVGDSRYQSVPVAGGGSRWPTRWRATCHPPGRWTSPRPPAVASASSGCPTWPSPFCLCPCSPPRSSASTWRTGTCTASAANWRIRCRWWSLSRATGRPRGRRAAPGATGRPPGRLPPGPSPGRRRARGTGCGCRAARWTCVRCWRRYAATCTNGRWGSTWTDTRRVSGGREGADWRERAVGRGGLRQGGKLESDRSWRLPLRAAIHYIHADYC